MFYCSLYHTAFKDSISLYDKYSNSQKLETAIDEDLTGSKNSVIVMRFGTATKWLDFKMSDLY